MPMPAQVFSDQLPETLDETEEMARLIDWSADGLMTDRPDLLREVMGKKKLPLPKPTPRAP